MSKSIPPTLTIEEAVSLLIGLDYIPSGLTALDMTAAFLEESEVDMENNPKSSICSARHDVCLARHQLATSLLNALNLEAANKDSEYLDRSEEMSPSQRFTTESLNHWGQDRFGITLWAPSATLDNIQPELADATWQDITIKIYADYRIGYKIKDGKYKFSSFNAIGLMGTNKNEPSLRGNILLAMSMGHKYPDGVSISASHKTSISVIRDALRKLVALADDPFSPYNQGDGWKPKFTLIDDRRNADDRAKRNAVHVSFDENIHDIYDEGSLGDAWLKDNDHQ